MAEDATRTEHRPRLGRGLAALLGAASEEPEASALSRGARKAPIEFLRPNPRNPRKRFDDAELEELTASIRERGVIQPILVRAIPRIVDAYEIIAGERRWRAAQRAGQHEIPIIVLEAGDREALEIAIIENVQRADLNALEEAAGYAQLGAEHGYSQGDIARIVGKSRSHVANTLRLTQLPEHSRALLAAGRISAGHARALLAIAEPDAIADRIVAEGLTVRDIERMGEHTAPAPRRRRTTREIDADTLALQEKLGLALGAKVTIRHTDESGDIRIAFRNFDQLDDFCRRLSQPAAR
jgi:ParB family transcriptional regulator, chromosome partitioning protein